MNKRKVLLIGWDAADWKVMTPLMESGQMPTVSQFVERGVMGNLATLKPVLSPMLWNSIATGKRPDKHGILGFTELNPHTGMVSPSLSTSRKVKALWNMVSQEGRKAHVVNWFASHPAEKINGVCVDETYSTPPSNMDGPWNLSSEAVHPTSLNQTLKDLRLSPTDLDGDTLQMFCALAHKADQTKDKRIGLLAKQAVEAINVHTAATYILEHEEWDFMGVYHGAIDHFCHLFMHYHPPQRPDISDEDFELYQDVINNCYRFHDVMLARMLQLAGDDATVVICSDHGFRSDHLRPPYTPMVPAGPAYWHRDQGVIMMAGPGVKEDELVHGATLLDIAPTVLALMDLPVAKDMDGRVLAESLSDAARVSFIESWESREGDFPDGMHPEGARLAPEQSQAILDQFVALGYIDPLDEDTDKAAIVAKREAKWNLAASFLDAGQVDKAIPLLADVVEDAPERKEIVLTLANCLQGLGLLDEAERLTLATTKYDVDEVAVYHTLAEVALANGKAEEALQYLKKLPFLSEGTTAKSSDGKEKEDGPSRHESFAKFYDLGRSLTLGSTFLKLREWQQALECFQNVLQLDPDHVRALHGSARCLLKLRLYDSALDYALRSVELEYRSFLGHYLLGVAFARNKQWEQSEEAFSVALRFRPGHISSYRMLAVVYKQLGNGQMRMNCQNMASSLSVQRGSQQQDPAAEYVALKERIQSMIPVLEKFYDEDAARRAAEEKAAKETKEATDAKIAAGADDDPTATEVSKESKTMANAPSGKEFLLVSGLPRSGTSLMMQMLNAGGVPAMTDEQRKADVDNPQGYLEWEAIKKIKNNPEIIEQAEGKATKVISMLLPQLPSKHRYRIIFMMRPIEEIVASQQKMISRLKTKGADLDEQQLHASLTQHRATILNTIRKMPADVFMVKYEHLINRTRNVVVEIQKFLGDDVKLDADAMCAQVRPELWRNKTSVSTTK